LADSGVHGAAEQSNRERFGEVPMSLRLKMILGIGAILLLVILVFAILASSGQANHLLIAARHEADLVVTLTDRAIANAMEGGEQEAVQAILMRLGESPGVIGIRIVDSGGTIVRSSNPEEIGRALQKDRLPQEETLEPVWEMGDERVGVFRPILNGAKCTRCHAHNSPTLGSLQVRVKIPADASDMDRQWTFMILAAVAGLLGAGGMIWLLFTFVVGQRIEVLSRTMSQVEAGDLTARVADDSRDELGRLGGSFNAMVVRLADARRQLEDRHAEQIRRAENLASLGKMAAGIAHEINNPIAGMLNCVRTLLRGIRDEPRRIQYLEMLQEGLDRIGRTVGQLLNFAREAKPQLARTDLRALLQHCLALLEHDLAARQITCSLARDGNLPTILADRYQLEQVFLNILKNSIEAMPDGGRITVSMSVREREAGPFLEVQIADTGIGIPSENLPRIFDPFFTTKEVGEGTGLGLSVSYGIVRAHGGFIEVKSEVGKGSLFSIGLPVREG
jgi:two-component system NtrC family sensor kinase